MNINSMERYLLEALGDKKKTLQEFKLSTQINEKYFENTLQKLISKRLVNVDENYYFINRIIFDEYREKLNSPHNLTREIIPIFENVVESGIHKRDDVIFKLKKVKFDSFEEKIFLNMIQDLEKFIQENNKANHENLKDQKLFSVMMKNYSHSI